MKWMTLPLLLAILLSVTSCTAFSSSSSGGAYLTEEVILELTEEDKIWAELEDMLGALTVDSIEIEGFADMKSALKLHRESGLNYIYGKHYLKYAGNAEQLDKINAAYPTLSAIAAIPEKEVEYELYRCFGGNVKITHESMDLFTYLESEKVYVPVTAPISGSVDMVLISALETENTYRITFECRAGEKSVSYSALLIKREDGSCYFDRVEKIR